MSDSPELPQTKPIGRNMLIIGWILAMGLLTYGFQQWESRQNNPNRAMHGSVRDDGVREIVLLQNSSGHYVTDGNINGVAVTFILDTGASDVVIPGDLADRLAIQRGPAQQAFTANGTITVYLARIDELTLGNIVLNDLRASINPAMQGEAVLLGMSGLRDLEFTQSDRQLTIRHH
jgi:aspartyl protease family protein